MLIFDRGAHRVQRVGEKDAGLTLQAIEGFPSEGCFVLSPDGRYVGFNELHARTTEAYCGRTPVHGELYLDLFAHPRLPPTIASVPAIRSAATRRLEELQAALRRALEVALRGQETSISHLSNEPFAEFDFAVSLFPLRGPGEGTSGVLGLHPPLEQHMGVRAPATESTVDNEQAKLADGILNELNNLAVGLAGALETLRVDVPTEEVTRELIQEVRNRTELARRLARTLRSGALPPATGTINVDGFIEDLKPRLRSLAPHITITVQPGVGGTEMRAHPQELEDALGELVRNAVEARAEKVVIRSRTAADDARWPVPLVPYFVLEVDDDGEGIRTERLPRVFEPYFGSRKHAQGLGLTRVRSIIRSHGGSIRVESRAPVGTKVVMRLPAMTTGGEPERTDAAKTPPTRQEHLEVFVVDDAPEVRRVLGRVLRHGGHQVFEAEDGIDALEKLEERGTLPDLVVLDLMMPRMDGVETYKALRVRSKSLPILITSGYHPSSLGFLNTDPHARFLPKPFSPSEVLGTLADLMST